MKRVSIKDVAKEAGVSTTTVSYVLNRHPGETISAETTQRVLDQKAQLCAQPQPPEPLQPSHQSDRCGDSANGTGEGVHVFQPVLWGAVVRHRIYCP